MIIFPITFKKITRVLFCFFILLLRENKINGRRAKIRKTSKVIFKVKKENKDIAEERKTRREIRGSNGGLKIQEEVREIKCSKEGGVMKRRKKKTIKLERGKKIR